MEMDEQMQRESHHTDSEENSQDGEDDGNVNSIASFLHKFVDLLNKKIKLKDSPNATAKATTVDFHIRPNC